MKKLLLTWSALLVTVAFQGTALAQTSITALPPNGDLSSNTYGVSTDAFDVKQGGTIISSSAVIFNADHAIGGVTPDAGEPYSVDFDGPGPGFISFKTPSPVSISGFNLFVGGDGNTPDSREFSFIGVSGSLDNIIFSSLGSFDFTESSYSNYGSNVLRLTSEFSPTVDQFFRIDAISKAQGTAQGGRILELDAISTPSVSAVPEPASWAMIIIGFGFIGAGLRHRQRRLALRYI